MKVNTIVKLLSEKFDFCIILQMSDLNVAESEWGIKNVFDNSRYEIKRKSQTA